MTRRIAALLLLGSALAPGTGAGEPAGSRADVFVRVTTAFRNGQVKVWTSDDGKTWAYAGSSAPYLPTETDGAARRPYLIALEYLPAYVRVGTAGSFLGRTSVDSIEALVGGAVRAPLGVEPAGEVLEPGNVRAADGKTAVIVHRGGTEVNGFVLRFAPTPRPPSRRARTVRFGNYTGPGAGEDRRAEAIAAWDFTVFQQGPGLEACVRKVKARNPGHRVVLRLVLPGQSFLLYAYDPVSREAIGRMVEGQFEAFADLVDTVTLSEEEPGNMMRGIYGSPIPPEAVFLWRRMFERETGRDFSWPGPEVDRWMGDKFHAMLNDLHDRIKRRYPKIAVYQWVELRGYGNISGFPEYVAGETLKMDGYVLEWLGGERETLVETPAGPASVRTSFFARYLRNLAARNNLAPRQVLGQVWAHDPADPSTMAQIAAERDEGIEYIYFFWPNAATPEVFDLCGESDAPEWRHAREVWKAFRPLMEAERARRGR